MPDLLIIAPTDSITLPPGSSSPALEMKRAVLSDSGTDPSASLVTGVYSIPDQVDVWTVAELEARSSEFNQNPDLVVCPLTLDVPNWLQFSGKDAFLACANIYAVRQQVREWHYLVAEGNHWLPIVATARGVLFGEVITQAGQEPASYQQPLHLADAQRQPLYRLGQLLIRSLQALPGVYLLQFGLQDNEILFDRLIPFPDFPAIASVGVQSPDLYQCHWACLTHQPIRDLKIAP